MNSHDCHTFLRMFLSGVFTLHISLFATFVSGSIHIVFLIGWSVLGMAKDLPLHQPSANCMWIFISVMTRFSSNPMFHFLAGPMQISQQSTMTTERQECAGCKKKILDRYLLKAMDQYWHEDCLKCSCCDCRLGEVGSTLFTKANLLLCRRDYLRYKYISLFQ